MRCTAVLLGGMLRAQSTVACQECYTIIRPLVVAWTLPLILNDGSVDYGS